jgi:hypothetical protein
MQSPLWPSQTEPGGPNCPGGWVAPVQSMAQKQTPMAGNVQQTGVLGSVVDVVLVVGGSSHGALQRPGQLWKHAATPQLPGPPSFEVHVSTATRRASAHVPNPRRGGGSHWLNTSMTRPFAQLQVRDGPLQAGRVGLVVHTSLETWQPGTCAATASTHFR